MRLHLDYAGAPHAHPRWVWQLLAIATASVAMCAWAYVDRQAEHDGLQLRLEARTRAGKPAQPRMLPAEQQAAMDARAESATGVLRELGRPWPALFERLEETHGERIALLSVNLEGAKGTLRIAGEGRHLVDVLAYVERLSTDTFLTDVVLEQHEVLESDAQKPVRFSLSARWGRG